MAKAPVNEVFSTLKSYARKLSDGERTPAEIASALNDWAHESGQTLKAVSYTHLTLPTTPYV